MVTKLTLQTVFDTSQATAFRYVRHLVHALFIEVTSSKGSLAGTLRPTGCLGVKKISWLLLPFPPE
jgi:hypothetical protein